MLLFHESSTAAWARITCLLCCASTIKSSGAAASLQDMAQAVRSKAHRKRALQKGVRWQIGGDCEIAVSLYILFSKATVPTSVLVEAHNLSPMKREAALICADSGQSVLLWECVENLAQLSQMLCFCESSSHSRWLAICCCPGGLYLATFVTMLH